MNRTQTYLGKTVIELRRKKKWSQEKLSARANISLRTIQAIENHSLIHPRIDTVGKLAKTFNCSWNRLLQSTTKL